jgi:hypothetical protein
MELGFEQATKHQIPQALSLPHFPTAGQEAEWRFVSHLVGPMALPLSAAPHRLPPLTQLGSQKRSSLSGTHSS